MAPLAPCQQFRSRSCRNLVAQCRCNENKWKYLYLCYSKVFNWML